MSDETIAHPRATYPTPEQRLDARARRLWAEKKDAFVYLGQGVWLVPSQSKEGVRYRVELRGDEPGCYRCPAAAYEKPCAHYRSAKIAQIRTAPCSSCGERLAYRELAEVTEDHDSLTWFVGDLLCVAECAGNHGVL